MPCIEYLSQVRRAREEIQGMGATALAVASGAPYQARSLMSDGTWFPCLIDPPKRMAQALGIKRIGLGWLDPVGLWAYVRAAFRGSRQGRVTDPIQAPGLAILDADARARWVHRGSSLGDYPPLEVVLAKLRSL